MKNVKRSYFKILNVVASLALFISTVTANSTCWYVMYQEKMPDKLKELQHENK